MTGTRQRRLGGWLGAVLVVTFAVFWPARSNGYALDDALQARATLPDGRPNAMVCELRPIGDYFGAHYWAGAGNPSLLYRPITVASFAVVNHVSDDAEDAAGWHHLLNIVLHVLATALVFPLARVFVPAVPALVAAAAFGIHAIHSEVVAGIVGRAELLAFCFGALGLLSFRRGAASVGLRRGAAWFVAGSAFFVAFASKESALGWVPFLGVFTIGEALMARKRACGELRRRLVFGLAVVAVPLFVFVALRAIALREASDPGIDYLSNPLFYADAATRIATALQIWVFGLYRTLAPFALASDYGPATFAFAGIFDVATLACAALLIGLVVAGLAVARTQPLLFVAMACFVGFSFTTSNVPFAIGTIFGERLYYTPSLGLCLVFGWLASRVRSRPGAIVLGVLLVPWIVASAVTVLARNPAWRDDDALLRADLDNNPRSVRLLNNRAAQLHGSDDPAERKAAGALWLRAIELDPEYVDALANYGAWLAAQGRFADAEPFFQRALLAPEPRRLDHRVHEFLGYLYLETQRPAEAAAAFARLIELGDRAAAAGDRDTAAARYRTAAQAGLPQAVRADALQRLRGLGLGQ